MSDRTWAATGVAAARGTLYVLETRSEAFVLLGRAGAAARVWRLGPDGSRKLLATLEP